jgi:hypothetical protein
VFSLLRLRQYKVQTPASVYVLTIHSIHLNTATLCAAVSLLRRLRQYKVLTPAGAYVPAAMPGMADLTLKMKKIDPDAGVDGLQLPSLVSSKLLWVGRQKSGGMAGVVRRRLGEGG